MALDTTKVRARLHALAASFTDLEAELEPILAQSLPESLLALDTIQQAKLQTLIPYVVYDLIFIYLKARGIDPKTHPVIGELDRIRQYIEKIQKAETPPTRSTGVDKEVASRFIKHAITHAQLKADAQAWKKTAAEDEGDGDGASPSQGEEEEEEETAKTKTKKKADVTTPVASTSTSKPLHVPVKMTAKMLARQEYERELKEQDAMDEEEDVLEVFDDAEEDGMVVDDQDGDKDKGKGKKPRPNLNLKQHPVQERNEEDRLSIRLQGTETTNPPPPPLTQNHPKPLHSNSPSKKKSKKSKKSSGTSTPTTTMTSDPAVPSMGKSEKKAKKKVQ